MKFAFAISTTLFALATGTVINFNDGEYRSFLTGPVDDVCLNDERCYQAVVAAMATTLKTDAWKTEEVAPALTAAPIQAPAPAPAPSPGVFKKDKRGGNRQLRGPESDSETDANRELNMSCEACMIMYNQYWICVVFFQCEGGMNRNRRNLLAATTFGSYTESETKTFMTDPCWYNVQLETSKLYDTAVKSIVPDEFDTSGIQAYLQYYDVACAILKTTYGF